MGIAIKKLFMKEKISLLFLLCVSIFSLHIAAQPIKKSVNKNHSIGIFAPLYLDSVFQDQKYRFGKKFPRFTLPGLDFVQGAQIALDTLATDDQSWEIFLYDTKSDSLPIEYLIQYKLLDNLDMIIADVKEENLLALANFAKEKKIKCISASYPNDGGISNNPYLYIVNPTLKTHCEALYSYILQNHSYEDNIILIRPSGSQEDRVENYFKTINNPDQIPLCKINTLILDSNYADIEKKLDSNKKNIIIAGSLDEDFCVNICNQLKWISSSYKYQLFGMPNWNTFKIFDKKEKILPRDFCFYYTSSFYHEKSDSISKFIQNAYLKMYKGIPSDYAYKGFELMDYFCRPLLNQEEENIENTAPDLSVFSNYNFIPVHKNQPTRQIDYFENKHLFYIKRMNGKNYKAF